MAVSRTEEPRVYRRARPRSRRRWPARVAVGTLAVVAVLGGGVGVRALTQRGEVVGGVRVAGVDVGGASAAQAANRLREQLQPRLDRPLGLPVGGLTPTGGPPQPRTPPAPAPPARPAPP